jgi:hypothetical protein
MADSNHPYPDKGVPIRSGGCTCSTERDVDAFFVFGLDFCAHF